ncbi:polymerase delta-interacting protein 3-like isoform X1 [Euwallacea similis]|uniref:polymerase delta-interacting protein 3-like isoform X1 n=1 Tax=Euwallacea similis TaxID=1736056 RepID=UPI00344D7C19
MAKESPLKRNANGRAKKKTINRPGKGTNPKSNPKFKKRLAKGKGKPSGKPIGNVQGARSVQDARQRLLQKKRTNVVTDARDVLAKKGQVQDARNRLDKMRSGRGVAATKTPSTNSSVKVIGNSILQKVDRNGKISLITNKSRNQSDINLTIQKQLGLLAPSRPAMKRSPIRRAAPQRAAPIRKTIINELNWNLDHELSPLDPLGREYDQTLYKWVKPELKPASHLISSLEPTRQAVRAAVREELMLAKQAWPELITRKPVRVQPSSYIDMDAVEDDDDMPLVSSAISRIALKGSTRVSNVHSRLDSIPRQQVTHGILSQAKTKVVVPAGHRIVVSNLQSTVTEDDIKELFEDIGQLLSAKLVRSGVAEVIYKNLKDAQKAVDTYHNRQLDGQPMKCLLVNKRPINQPTGSLLSKSEGPSGRGTSSSDSYNKLVPDISTIHKVLFQKK